MITHLVSTLSTTAKMIVDCSNVDVNLPCYVRLQEASAAIVIGGSAAVTTANGQTVAATSGVRDLILGPGDHLWAVASTGTPTVRVLATGGAGRLIA
jgi:hypothetical protein